MDSNSNEINVLIKMSGIRKKYGQIEVLHGVDLEVKKAEVHALIGENGAGKSTMMKILMGEVKMDQGTISVDGDIVKISSPNDAHTLGLRMIHQEILLVPDMAVAENIFSGVELKKWVFVKKKEQEKKAQEILDNVGIDIKATDLVRDLKTAQRQMVEIAAAVSFGARLIIMDEPTSAISQKETEILFSIIKRLKAEGISFIYISHRMDEIFQIADSVTVMRDGCFVSRDPISNYDSNKLISQMVGRDLQDYFPDHFSDVSDEVILKVDRLSRKNEYRDISFELHKGEILGFGGLIGAGRTEMVSSLFGLTKPDSGDIYLKGQKVNIRNTASAIELGIALIPEDRKHAGLNLNGNIEDNIMMAVEKKYKKGLFISYSNRRKASEEMVSQLSIKISSLKQLAGKLSGGNQQKVVLAKWLLEDSEILILDEPTRGIDVGAKAEIYKLIVNMAKAGKSIIMISSEMPELLGICDRIAVMYEGRITGVVERKEATQEKIMAYAANIVKREGESKDEQ